MRKLDDWAGIPLCMGMHLLPLSTVFFKKKELKNNHTPQRILKNKFNIYTKLDGYYAICSNVDNERL